MKKLALCLGGLLLSGIAGAASADIYSWVDAEGIRHFSNHVPPKSAEAFEITVETPYVPPSAEELREAQKAEILAEVERKIAEMEAANVERLRSAQREIEAAREEAASAIEEAEALKKAAELNSRPVKKTVVYYRYFPHHPGEHFHQKKPVPRQSGIRKHHRPGLSEGRLNHLGPKSRKWGRSGYQAPRGTNRIHPSGRFGPDRPPGFLLRIR